MIVQIGSGGAGGDFAGTGGGSGAGGGSSAGGATGAGGAAGIAGSGGAFGTGGAVGTGGAPGSGGAHGVGGAPGMGGALGVGGALGMGGARGMGGAPGVGGARGMGGAPGVGGASGAGGAAGCGPSTCANGCCAAGRCITATTAQQCGTRGAACTSCGGCQLCGANGACAIAPTSNWQVLCASAQLTVAPPTGTTWDPAGVAGDGTAPDPFCQFEKPAGVIDTAVGATTRTINDSFTATWNQVVTAANTTITAAELMSADSNAWRVWVGDNEFNGRGALACQVRPPLSATALLAGQSTVTNLQNCVSFTVTLVCRP